MAAVQAAAARSSASTSASLSSQPSAPRFSSACARVRAPTMGMVSFAMHQFTATWAMVFRRAAATASSSRSSGPMPPRICGKRNRRSRPSGTASPAPYFPESIPRPSGE